MRTFFVIVLVALVVAVGVGFVVGLLAVTADHPDSRYIITLTVNTDKFPAIGSESSAHQLPGTNADELVDVKGKVTMIRPEKNEMIVSENVKNWTFTLAPDGKVFLNDQAVRLADLKAGDDAKVSFDRQEDQLVASVVRCSRK